MRLVLAKKQGFLFQAGRLPGFSGFASAWGSLWLQLAGTKQCLAVSMGVRHESTSPASFKPGTAFHDVFIHDGLPA